MDSNLKVIKKFQTSINKKGEYGEYFVYKENNLFVVECYSCIKNLNKTHKKRDHYETFENEVLAIKKYNELLSAWGA